MPNFLSGVPDWLLAIGAIALCILALSAVFGFVLERVLGLMSLELPRPEHTERPASARSDAR